jgi:DNA polymerase-3 subunit delta'
MTGESLGVFDDLGVFNDLVDQQPAIEILSRAIAAAHTDDSESQEMSHAWLFTGPPGSGRSTGAIAFAAALVCPHHGCGKCQECITTKAGNHPDVEIFQTQGLSIKIDEVRELVVRAGWSPSNSRYRVVIIEDCDRLTESAANALLKAIEEPGAQTVWLLCAPTLDDVIPTIRSRLRSLTLRSPSPEAVQELLVSEGIDPQRAIFAARAAGGHIGRARYLARDESARSARLNTLKAVLNVNDVTSAFNSAAKIVDAAKDEANRVASEKNEKEIAALREAWGEQGTRLASGGSKALKELEKDQKSRLTRMIRDYLDQSLLDIASLYRDILICQISPQDSRDRVINIDLWQNINDKGEKERPEKVLEKIEIIMKTRDLLRFNAAPLSTIEALMVQLR